LQLFNNLNVSLTIPTLLEWVQEGAYLFMDTGRIFAFTSA